MQSYISNISAEHLQLKNYIEMSTNLKKTGKSAKQPKKDQLIKSLMEMDTNLKIYKKTEKSSNQIKPDQFVKNLKEEVIREIRLMPDKAFLEEVNSSNFLNDDEAMKKFKKKYKHEIQWILNAIDIEAVLKRADSKLTRLKKKN